MDTNLNIIQPGDVKTFKVPRVLYLLHPLGGNADSWTRWTSAERYAADSNIIVVMPEVQRSFYIDMAKGGRYFTYITEELPETISNLFGISPKRENTYICGSSMGGYGSLKAAISRPDLYGACACFSGAYDLDLVKSFAVPIPGGLKDLMAILGDKMEVDTDDDIYVLAKKHAHDIIKPKVLMCCGDGDFLLQASAKTYRDLKSHGYNIQYRQWKGAHNWQFWDESLRLAVAFFNGIDPPEKPYT